MPARSMIISVGSASSCYCFFPFRACIMLFQFNYPTVKNNDKANKFPPRVTGGKWGTGSLDGVDRRLRCWSGGRDLAKEEYMRECTGVVGLI